MDNASSKRRPLATSILLVLVLLGLSLVIRSKELQGQATVVHAPDDVTPTPFHEDLWAALGAEAWFVERGYVNAPPSAGSAIPCRTAVWMDSQQWAGEYWGYLPVIRRYEAPIPTPTLTPSPSPTPPSVEARALWLTRYDWTCLREYCPDGQLPGPDTIRQMVATIDAAGFNMILFQVRAQGDAYYQPGLEPWAARLTGTLTATLGQDPGWDPLTVMIAEAHARGIQVHGHFNVYPVWLGTSPPPDHTSPLHPFWAWSHATGSSWSYWRQWDTRHQPMTLNDNYLWASPGNDWQVQAHIVATAVDVLKRYDLDGLHLDMVRYSNSSYSCDPCSEVRWGTPCFTNGDYASWQRAQVTHLVSRIYNEGVVSLGRHALLSAAVWWYPRDLWGLGCSGGNDYYQDSQGWLSAGVIDAEMPMLYGCSAFAGGAYGDSNWSTVVSDWLDHRASRYVFPGIHADVGWESIEARIGVERALAAARGTVPGHVIYSYSVINAHGYWDEFAAGPYKQPAVPPTQSWHL